MTINIIMPALSPTMKDGKLIKWFKKEGDEINPGDVLAEIETDKATMEIEAVDKGILSKILISAGTESVKVNEIIATMNDNKNDSKIAKSNKKEKKEDQVKIKEINKSIEEDSSRLIKPDNKKVLKDIKYENITVREAINKAIAEEMRRDNKVFLIGEEVGEYDGAYKVSQGLLKEFGKERIIDTPISEEGFTGLAIGSAFNGLKPIVEYMTFNFSMQAIDQIVNTASKTHYMSGGQINVPIVFRGPNGAASQTAAQHSQDFTSWYSHCPGLKVVSPSNAADAKGLLKSAIRDKNPVVFLENEIMYSHKCNVPIDKNYLVPLGKANIVKEGDDATIISFSLCISKCLEAHKKLKDEGINAEIIDLRTIRPMDKETIINSVKKTNRVVCVEECWPFSGINSELISVIVENAFDYLDAPIIRISSKDVPMPYALNLENACLPQTEDIFKAVKQVCYRN
ncbi:MAG: pyruvate dehydrogenase complex E1 component subunit beta [Pelagibacteraceae bacterium]|nr:pyruvate dehydrogenase complex E1 component subunit beta [Pelagibacteraceae bacterium]|tara:strand:- start:82651 stop:84018 length:1368 start_codon:yes stop_codon:yes gene_type:complete